MKYRVKGVGLSHARKTYKTGEGFPANVKGFDYEKALARGLIEENTDGIVPKRSTAKTTSSGIQGTPSDGNPDEGNGDRG